VPAREGDVVTHEGTAVSEAGQTLTRLAAIAMRVEAEALAADAERAAERLREGRFYLACVGQFKRGKSTLINALIGTPVLPTAVVPVTAVVTVVRWGPRLSARVRFGERDWEEIHPASLAAYVSEDSNPGNEKNVTGAEVFVPSRLLESGMCLVDTPGIGSVSEANTAATRGFVPHIDAALVVLGADPPLSGDELALIEALARTVETFVFVLNKADRQSPAEREQARAFTRRVLRQRLGRDVPTIYEVSALERMQRDGAPRDWDALVARLGALAGGGDGAMLRAAERREVALVAARLRAEIAQQRTVLERPLEESERRLEALRAAVARAETTLGELGHRLSAVEERLAAAFTLERDRFFARAAGEAAAELAAAIAGDVGPAAGRRERALDRAFVIGERWLGRWRAEQEPQVAALYRDGMAQFVALVDETRAALATLPELASLPPSSVEAGLRAPSGFFYTHLMSAAPSSALDVLLDRALGRRRVGAITRAAQAFLARFLEVNSARMKNDFVARVVESRRLVERDVREGLESLVRSADHALAAARAAHAAGRDAVRSRLAWLAACEGEIPADAGAPREEAVSALPAAVARPPHISG
jgi:GTP-binding protein EngB required for normal cell division